MSACVLLGRRPMTSIIFSKGHTTPSVKNLSGSEREMKPAGAVYN
jgi:hypothetical protein